MLIHTIFDILAWVTSMTTLLILRRTWFPKNAIEPPFRTGYLVAVLFGAGLFAWVFGTANLWLSGQSQMGRSIEGALFGAILAVETYKRANGISARTGAIYALPAALGIAVGRIGCLLSGMEDFTYGIPTNTSWGWNFGDGVLRHPVALYESIAMGVFALCYIINVAKRSVFWKENGFYLMVAFYGFERFFLEFWKPYGPAFVGLSLFQLLSIAMVAYGVAMIMTAHRDT